jgi:predicted alpha/beta-hydrolase family hydrolase
MTPARSRVKQASASPLLIEGKKGAIAALILAHGSATHQTHPHLTALSEALNRQKIMTLRFNFAYRKAGRAFPGPMTESVSDYLTAADHFGASRFKLPLFFGGHSYGSRVATHAAAAVQTASNPPRISKQLKGMVAFSLPLHPRGKPHLKRWSHLQGNTLPLIILAGDRDPMIENEQAVTFLQTQPNAELCWIAGADHGFKQTKAAIKNQGSAYFYAAKAARRWMDSIG